MAHEHVTTFAKDIFGDKFVFVVSKTSRYEARKTHGRVFVFGEPSPEQYVDGIDRVPPYSKRGDDPELDAEWRRYNATEAKTVREAAKAALVEAGVKFSKVRFSRYAGCSCPCSPGVVVDGLPAGTNFYVSVKTPEAFFAEVNTQALEEA